MSLKYRLLNGICRIAYESEYRRFMKIGRCSGDNAHSKAIPDNNHAHDRNSLGNTVASIQKDILMNYVRRNKDTEYGRKYHFSEINSYEDYCKNVPLTTYEDYEAYIEKIASGEKKILTDEPVNLFELTSGSSGGKKLIPYTATLKKEFQCGIYPWLADIYKKVTDVSEGTSYWSITPITTKKSYSPCGIPIGFEEDTEYFGSFIGKLMNSIFAVNSSEVKFVKDMDEFYHKTALGMLKGNKLALISVWNPSLLTLICEYIKDHAEELETELKQDVKNSSTHTHRPANTLKELIEAGDFGKVFPSLRLISCWTDASASKPAEELKKIFPTVPIEPKGILATECFVSLPFYGETGSRLSVYSHFFEFKSLETGEITTADKLTKGLYELIVTTGGGFYRYCIGDVIEVLESDGNTPPLIKFMRRAGITSDLFGEKLTDDYVRNVCTKLNIADNFCLLVPHGNRYILYTDADNLESNALDTALRESFHYDYCRSLGQLQQAKIIYIDEDGYDIYCKRLISEGMRLGDIKPAFLSRLDGWDAWFTQEQ